MSECEQWISPEEARRLRERIEALDQPGMVWISAEDLRTLLVASREGNTITAKFYGKIWDMLMAAQGERG